MEKKYESNEKSEHVKRWRNHFWQRGQKVLEGA